ncbi:hypothetical protein ACFVH6_21915 [Spirillospora sp. NPDC127200]
MTTYKVTAPYIVHVPVTGHEGAMLQNFHQGARLPESVPESRIRELLDGGMIAEVDGGDSPAGNDEDDDGFAQSTPAQQSPVQPAGRVNARSSKAELVDYAVAQGMARDEADAMSRDALLARYVRKGE